MLSILYTTLNNPRHVAIIIYAYINDLYTYKQHKILCLHTNMGLCASEMHKCGSNVKFDCVKMRCTSPSLDDVFIFCFYAVYGWCHDLRCTSDDFSHRSTRLTTGHKRLLFFRLSCTITQGSFCNGRGLQRGRTEAGPFYWYSNAIIYPRGEVMTWSFSSCSR